MTIDDAVNIISQSLKNMNGGEIFIPRKLKMFKIYDLLKILIKKFSLIQICLILNKTHKIFNSINS